MRCSTIVLVLVIPLAACGASMPAAEGGNGERQAATAQYLRTADNLGSPERAAMREGRPFVGMTYEEANLAMSLVEVQVEFGGSVLQASFQGSGRREYVVVFDCAEPNRVKDWSEFSRSEVESMSDFRDVHPCPPVPTLNW